MAKVTKTRKAFLIWRTSNYPLLKSEHPESHDKWLAFQAGVKWIIQFMKEGEWS